MDFQKYYEARNLIESLLIKDLAGPVDPLEVIEDTTPIDYYITGKLFPQGMSIGQKDMERSGLDDETQEADSPLNLCHSVYPSSVGISFSVKPGVRYLRATCSFAHYLLVDDEEEQSPLGRPKRKWHRKPCTVEVEIDTDELSRLIPLCEGLDLCCRRHVQYPDNSRTFSLVMVNTNKSSSNMVEDNKQTFFQTEIVVTGVNETDVFIEKKSQIDLNKDAETLTLEMLYSHNKVFAAGHGVSAEWKQDGEYASEIRTSYLPSYELLQMRPTRFISPETLRFEFLAIAPVRELGLALNELVTSYEKWINRLHDKIEGIPPRYRAVAHENERAARECLGRIKRGIEILTTDETAIRAFQLSNQVMVDLQQQQAGSRPTAWYPFQLAFILQEISSIVDPEDTFRDIVDLLWFPTGGGKTEAYLGLSSFTIFHRRLRAVMEHRPEGGVTVLMRYTLRLLTLQQFERATALICACELLRRRNPDLLGSEQISTGLWVGGGLTPNKKEEAARLLNRIIERGYAALGEKDSNPVQVLKCPWCGHEIKPTNYEVTADKMIIRCGDSQCEFAGGLPVYLLDDDVYMFKPTLLIGTVDKFARMAWDPRVARLFSIGSNYGPPELIIQDELHLISGPLGTMTGLYETAVDQFCQRESVRAKIISSTATICNARHQILNLFARDFRQFPPQGVDIRDSYFAEESPSAERPARKYFGILAPGTSGNTLLIRTFAIMIFATRYLKELQYPTEVIDSFWTLTGYFNSLKQLGGAVINVIDDVHGRLKYLYGTKFAGYLKDREIAERNLEFDELTSRKPNSDIGKILKRLSERFPNPSAYDLVLASNMLSVGIDIGRLGLMVLQGQPKSNAEYIQATSRVGRQTPGLVITMYDASRSRDRSHYEQFLAYHSSLYRYVEATSLTPFAERARDRGLHAVLISLCRQLVDRLRTNESARNIVQNPEEVEGLAEAILARVRIVDGSEEESTRRQLQEIISYWDNLASCPELVYQRFRQGQTPLLSMEFDGDEGFPTLNSMRNVDAETVIVLEG